MIVRKIRCVLKSGNRLVVTISDGRPRSLNQNALFHKWCGEISEYFNEVGKTHLECGAPVTPQTIKAKLKATFLPTEEEITWSYAKNRVVKRVVTRGTAKLPKGQMNNFMTCVHSWAVDYSIPITVPEESEFYQLQQEQGLAA